jgi:DNA-binding response OmpR family regulator
MNEKYHILLIEDDPSIARGLQAGLERDGYRVTWKARGEHGVIFARKNPPHLILLDVRLPDGSGFDFCRQMRQLGMHLPILILTVQQDETDKVLGLELGADDYITKPFSLKELTSRIRAHLRRAYGEFSNADANFIYIENMVIDLSRGLVKINDQTLSLTPLEFRLLVYLAQNRGRALSRAQIIAEVWGYTPDVDSEQIVTVHIRHLREKVEADPETPTLILTVPGIGYRMSG